MPTRSGCANSTLGVHSPPVPLPPPSIFPSPVGKGLVSDSMEISKYLYRYPPSGPLWVTMRSIGRLLTHSNQLDMITQYYTICCNMGELGKTVNFFLIILFLSFIYKNIIISNIFTKLLRSRREIPCGIHNVLVNLLFIIYSNFRWIVKLVKNSQASI